MNGAPVVLALHQTPSRTALALGPRGLPERTATITVDDGYASNARHLHPLLRELGLPWTVFISVRTLGRANHWDLGWVGHRERHLTEDELRTLTSEGVGVGSHGMEHEDLTKAAPAALTEALAARGLGGGPR